MKKPLHTGLLNHPNRTLNRLRHRFVHPVTFASSIFNRSVATGAYNSICGQVWRLISFRANDGLMETTKHSDLLAFVDNVFGCLASDSKMTRCNEYSPEAKRLDWFEKGRCSGVCRMNALEGSALEIQLRWRLRLTRDSQRRQKHREMFVFPVRGRDWY
jgi:hypothetical protein